MATHPTRFTWARHPCPPWCEVEHHDDDHPDDRVHRGAAQHLTIAWGPESHRTTEEILTLAELPLGGRVSIAVQQAEGPWHLSTTPEGAELLHDALRRTLAAVAEATLSPGRSPGPPSSARGSPESRGPRAG